MILRYCTNLIDAEREHSTRDEYNNNNEHMLDGILRSDITISNCGHCNDQKIQWI